MPGTDIDTDQIIPARFLTTTSREGLGVNLFADWRYLPDGSDNPEFVLNQPANKQGTILVAGRNFGCGSSREHAPWALLDYGFKAIISSEIADIFRSNALKNGLVPAVLDPQTHAELLRQPGAAITVDVENTCVILADGRRINFPIDGFARHCLLHGVDQLGYLLNQSAAIGQYEEQQP